MRRLKILLIALFVFVFVIYTTSSIYQHIVKQNTAPVITCETETLEVSVSADDLSLLQGVSAMDAEDGDLTNRILIGGISNLLSNNTAEITYLVFDNDNNMGTCTRYLHYIDYEGPKFVLKQPLIFTLDQKVSLTGRLQATDMIDGDISESIRISTLDLPPASAGVYTITVQVTNSMGDTVHLSLPIILNTTDSFRPVIQLKEYLIYMDVGSPFNPRDYLENVSAPVSDVDDPSELLSAVAIENNVDPNTPGTYQVTYTYSGVFSTGMSILTVVVE